MKKTKVYKRAVSLLYHCGNDTQMCTLTAREFVENDIKTLTRKIRVWEVKNYFEHMNPVAFISLSFD